MFCYFYLLADFLKTMKNTRFFASFLANTKKKKRQAARAAGAEGSQQAGERRQPRNCRPSERKRGAGKQPQRLCRVTNKIYRSPERSESGEAAWALERERARKKTRSKAHRERQRPRRLAERLEDEARTTDARELAHALPNPDGTERARSARNKQRTLQITLVP